MSEQRSETAGAAAGAANTHGPAGLGVEDQAANVAAAAGPVPCGCGERIDVLEARASGIERVARASAYLAMVVAAGLIYLLWFGPGGPGGDK